MGIKGFFGGASEEQEKASIGEGFDKEEWKKQKQAERDAMQATVLDLLDVVKNDPDWREAYLNLAGRMGRKYSTRNLLLICAQCPEAVKLADFESWAQKGYRITKGETGILIYEPAEIRGEDGSVKTVFNARRVYDLSQTNAVKREQAELPFTNNQILNAIAGASPWTIVPAEGLENIVVTDSAKQQIRIRQGATPREVFGPLLKEVLRARLELNSNIAPGPESVFAASAGAYMLGTRYRLEMEMDDFPALKKPPETITCMEPRAFESLLDVARSGANHLSKSMSVILGDKEQDLEGKKAVSRQSFPKKGGNVK